jgi:hypothetical protein
MARPCSVCTHSSITAIDALLADGRSARAVARDFGLSYDAVVRHARNHRKANVPTEDAPGLDPLADLVAMLRARAFSSSNPAAAREYRLALAAQAAQRSAAPAYQVLEDPEFIRVRDIILAATAPYPEVHGAIADALRVAGAD